MIIVKPLCNFTCRCKQSRPIEHIKSSCERSNRCSYGWILRGSKIRLVIMKVPLHETAAEERPGPPPSIVPPYWQHRRFESYASVNIPKPAPITLEDHTEETSEQTGSLWAKSVLIDDYVVIQGTVPSLRDYTVWNCKIDTLDVSIFFLTHFIPSLKPYSSTVHGSCV